MSNTAKPLLVLSGITKRFGAVEALRNVDLDVRAGEVVALLGDNGAGKSTLIKIVSGAHPPSGGSMLFDGKAVRQFDPRHAREIGIETIYQDLALAENLNVGANIFLGRELRQHRLGLPMLDRARMREEATQALEQLDIHIPDLNQPVGELSGGQRQAVAVARAVYWHAKLVIMDEPTAAVGVGEHEAILQLIARLAEHGVAVILITHTMADVWRVADRIVVLTRGAKALEGTPTGLGEDAVVRSMLFGRQQA
ncbi:ATP-binding cassette domain-containing protein [Acidihalobacter ferrooxydans]|uniref:ATP-binding cassette domain-containing protein n=1 Tax=Acidihalobacter ferrooxydans TaxID=1765967 RepID=UPI0018DE2577|nr:ATP-binding cassette domain-containing protein [Acidihalobacter ferrooxydans]